MEGVGGGVGGSGDGGEVGMDSLVAVASSLLFCCCCCWCNNNSCSYLSTSSNCFTNAS